MAANPDLDAPLVGFPFAMVELRGPSGSAKRVFADGEGRFEVRDLPEGTYEYKVPFLNSFPIGGEICIATWTPEGGPLRLVL